MHLSDQRVREVMWDMDWDTASEYGEPGYGSHGDPGTTCVVLGDYWVSSRGFGRKTPMQRRKIAEAEAAKAAAKEAGETTYISDLLSWDRTHPRIWAQLEAQGYEFEWHDEWVVDHETGKAYRCEPDSYGWTPSTVYTEGGDLLTPDNDIDEWIEWAVQVDGDNDPWCAITHAMVPDLHAKLGEAGFAEFQCGYQNGWYEGQTDDPKTISAHIWSREPEAEVLFTISSVRQFDMSFCAWVRRPETEEDDDG